MIHALPSSKNIRRVLVLYTGGTIGMKPSSKGYIPVSQYLPQLLKNWPQFHDKSAEKWTDLDCITPPSAFGIRVAYRILEYQPLLDSSNIGNEDWKKMAQDIFHFYPHYDAFIILHGTDTMSFTASALSFMLEDLSKTVIVTGSQLPLSEWRTDGIENFLGSLFVAGNYEIPEVCIFFHNKLLRGNRSIKLISSDFDAFHSGNFPPLVELGFDVKINWHLMNSPQESFRLSSEMDPHVGVLRIFPGITGAFLKSIISSPFKGLILHTYGSGNAPDTDRSFLDAIEKAIREGMILVNCTQCFRGAVQGHYATGQALADIGVVSGADMTIEAALTKLSYLFGKNYPLEEIRLKISQNLRGELTESDVRTRFSFRDKLFLRSIASVLEADTSEVSKALNPILLGSSARTGDLDLLKRLLKRGASVQESDEDQRTPLHFAATAGQLSMVTFLVQQGAKLEAKDRWKHTALYEAIYQGHSEVAHFLMAQGAKLPEKELGVLLCQAAAEGDIQTLHNCFSCSVSPALTDYDQRTPLHLAVAEGQIEIVKLLLQHHAPLNAVDRLGKTVLEGAQANLQISQILEEWCSSL